MAGFGPIRMGRPPAKAGPQDGIRGSISPAAPPAPTPPTARARLAGCWVLPVLALQLATASAQDAKPGPPANSAAQQTSSQAENTGDDFARPLNLFQLLYEYKTAPGSGSEPGTTGVPCFMSTGGANPAYFLQTPKQVVIIHSEEFRHVYLDVPHSANPKPSWYGESVGHYEGDTLVVDTIGQNDRLPVDVYRTPNTEKLHVVERWRMIDDGKMMEVTFTVNDPDAFLQPWSGMRRYRRVPLETTETICAENNQHLFDYHIPLASKPDF